LKAAKVFVHQQNAFKAQAELARSKGFASDKLAFVTNLGQAGGRRSISRDIPQLTGISLQHFPKASYLLKNLKIEARADFC